MNVQWAIIGTDDEAMEFVKRIRSSDNSRVKAVANADQYESFCFAKRTGAPAYYDGFDEILTDKNISSVYISRIDSSNVELVRKLLIADKAVLFGRIDDQNEGLDLRNRPLNPRGHLLPAFDVHIA